MQPTDSDPLRVIATDPPQLDAAEARALLRSHYGITASVASLVSERDQNFRVEADGEQFVLKISNAAEDPQYTEFQVSALRHIEAQAAAGGPLLQLPRVVLTSGGEASFTHEHAGQKHIVRLVTYVAGEPLGERPRSTELCRDLGRGLAQLGRLLAGFSHPGQNPSLLWDMKRAGRLRELLELLEEPQLNALVRRTLDDFEQRSLPALESLRWQVIHNDMNPENVLLDGSGDERVVGVIDFGDMLHSPLIVDVAVAAAYLRCGAEDSLRQISSFVAGYHSVTPLTVAELDILLQLICTRLATSVCVLHWRAATRGAEDEYLQASLGKENSAESFLQQLDSLDPERVGRVLRKVCSLA